MASDVKQVNVAWSNADSAVVVTLECCDRKLASLLYNRLIDDLKKYDVLHLNIVLPSGTFEQKVDKT